MKKIILILLLNSLLFAENPLVKVYFIEAIEERGKYIHSVQNDTLILCEYIHQSKRFPSKRAAKRYLKNLTWNYKQYGSSGFHYIIEHIYYVQSRRTNE